MTTFDRRERAFEAKFAFDQETLFKIGARRNRLFRQWVAQHLGLEGAEADNYAKMVVASDFKTPGDGDVFDKVWADIQNKGLDLGADEVRLKMAELLSVAQGQFIPEQRNHGIISADRLNRVRQSKAVWSWKRAKVPWSVH